jgi:hypothetical protein
VIYLKHVERSAAQQRREVEESTRYPAPTFMTPLRDLSIVEGEKVHFDAKVAPVGDPTMKVEWFCNGKAIAASKFWFALILSMLNFDLLIVLFTLNIDSKVTQDHFFYVTINLMCFNTTS